MFHEVIVLHQHIIKERLMPKKPGRRNLITRLEEALIHQLPKDQGACSAPCPKASILHEVKALHDTLQELEKASPAEKLNFSKRIILQAHSLCYTDGSDTATKLEALMQRTGIKAGTEDAKLLRKVAGLGRYWASCIILEKDARKYARLFLTTTVERLVSSNTWSYRGKTHRVHAEIQLVLHHDSLPKHLRPRAIGTSKKACYLCDLFITTHGGAIVSKTHGKLYPQWTLPNIGTWPAESVDRVRETLMKMRETLQAEIRKPKSSRTPLAPPIESSVEGSAIALSNPSVATITSALYRNDLVSSEPFDAKASTQVLTRKSQGQLSEISFGFTSQRRSEMISEASIADLPSSVMTTTPISPLSTRTQLPMIPNNTDDTSSNDLISSKMTEGLDSSVYESPSSNVSRCLSMHRSTKSVENRQPEYDCKKSSCSIILNESLKQYTKLSSSPLVFRAGSIEASVSLEGQASHFNVNCKG
ncbi:MAG: hypothetical protein M1819_005456 [Sarea resinae]|nr:MAG: hypothetical protein M1819_005456 [Sarea resinae]